MRAALLPVLLAFSLLPLRAAEPAASPTLASVAAEVATGLRAGGIVAGERSPDGTWRFSVHGRPGPAAEIAPEAIVFEIGSITKVMTGLLLAQSVIEGKVALDDPIAKHLPPDLALHPHVAAITLEQLAAHTSGLPRLPPNLSPREAQDPYADYGEEPLFAALAAFQPGEAPPRPHDYSNWGAGLLGFLLERIHGLDYEALFREKIGEPLGLTDTFIVPSPDQEARFAPAHSGAVPVRRWRLATLAGAGALRSTAGDLARFSDGLAAAETDPAHPLHAAWALARAPRVEIGGIARMGLGVMIALRPAGTAYQHGGGTGGYRSYLEWQPATGRGYVVLLNNDEPEAVAVVRQLQRALRPASPAPAAAPAAAPNPAAPALSAADLLPYAGVYAIDARARFTFVVDADGRLRGRLTGQPFLPLAPAGPDRFGAPEVGAEFEFSRAAADGPPTAVTLHQGGRELPAVRTGDAPEIRFPAAAELAAFVGNYELSPGQVLEMTVRRDHLVVKLTGQPALPVFMTGPDRFVYDVVEAALEFQRDATGAVTGVVLHQNDRAMPAPRKAD